MFKVFNDLSYSLSVYNRYIQEHDFNDINLCLNMRNGWKYINETYNQDNESVQHECDIPSWDWNDSVKLYKNIKILPFYTDM